MITHEPRGRQVDEARAGNLRIEGPVEGREFLHLRNPGLFEAPHEEAIRASGELVLHQEVEKVQMLQRGGPRLFKAQGQGLGHAREAQMPEPGRQLWIHEKSSKVYTVNGRMLGSSLMSGRHACAGVAWIARRSRCL